jgi:hypothetical protein
MPADVRDGSLASILAYPRHVRLAPESDRLAGVPKGPIGGTTGPMHCSKQQREVAIGHAIAAPRHGEH